MNPVSESAIPIRPAGFRPRLDVLDLLRGAVMIMMALDHARDFVGGDAIHFDPTDLTKTNAALFLTRWISISGSTGGFGLPGAYGGCGRWWFYCCIRCAFWFAALKQRRRDAWLSYF